MNAAEYPNAPGHRGVDTSISAGNAIAPSTGRLQRLALLAIGEVGSRGLTSQPAITGAEKRVREVFDSAAVAQVYARRIHAMYPALYRRIIDETGNAA